MVALPFPTTSTPGFQPGEGEGALINCRADKNGKSVAWYRSPGMREFCDLGFPGIRGALLVDNTLYVAVADKLLTVSVGGTVGVVPGVLSGEGPVTMARNNRAPADLAIVTENGAFSVIGGVVVDYQDPDVGSPNSISFLDGYFEWTYGDGLIRASELNSTDVNDQSFTKAEARPDGLIRGVSYGAQFLAFGPDSTEFYNDVGAQPFPLQRAEVLPVGLYGPWAVAGHDAGWSGPLIFVASDNTVRRLDGYKATPISTPDIVRDIEMKAFPHNLRASVYTAGGSSYWVLSSPYFTWEYNVTTGEWNQRRSYGLPRWRGEVTVKAFGYWLVGDTQSTKLSIISADVFTELGDPLIARAEGWLKSFPEGMRVGNLLLDFTTGQGEDASTDPTQNAPQAAVSWSFDGGGNWSNPLLRSLGHEGEYGRKIKVARIGRAKTMGVKVSWEISDPRWFQFRGGDLPNLQPRRS